ncbi:MAG: LEA type 2 family protein [Phycisphaerales bacterium]
MKSSRHTARTAAVLVLVLVLGVGLLPGCTLSSPPRLQVSGARAGPASGNRGVVLIDVVATNPNREGLPLKSVVYTVDLGGERVFEGRRDAQASVRGYGVQKITLPVPVSSSYVAGGQTRFRVAGEITYVAPETLAQTLYDNDLRKSSTAFSGEGVVAAGP